MAGTHSYSCPKCGVTKGGYYFRWTAQDAAEVHLWKKHRVDVTKNRRFSN
ncbi:hypothetical protein KDL01_04265 [Actinospica durhamensis]|uniref:Uncharacterized protein n=1 Tax=Actinospica durhamensis TaxID=1508375 RepID=A0A941EJ30_9ACTN|nr:hypothetical protein [Actinospica durhamensis]MBR7832457.1 hypothetical protein [Actinospica durhamensis]